MIIENIQKYNNNGYDITMNILKCKIFAQMAGKRHL